MSSSNRSPEAQAPTLRTRLLRPAGFPRLVAWALTTAVAGVGCFAPSETNRGSGVVPEGLTPYSVQMHIHGHSHHNGDPRPGSMQWHSHHADASGLDVLWWSDHSEMFDLSSPLVVNFDPRAAAPVLGRRGERQAGHLGGEPVSLALVGAPDDDREWIEAQADSKPGRERLVARSGAGSTGLVQSVYEVVQAGKAPRGFLLPRPVSSAAVLAIDLEPGDLGPDVVLEVEVALSWHHRGAPRRQALRYRLVPESGADGSSAPRLERGSVAVIEKPVAPGRSTVSFDLEKDAAALVDGTDNTITRVRFRVASRRAARAQLDVFGLELSSRSPDPDHQLAQLRRFAERYSREYGHLQNVGVEFLAEDEDYTHINAFLPDGALTGALAAGDEETWTDPALFVERVRRLGGVTSFNHLFGTTTARSRNPKYEQRRSRQRALDLLGTDAYGADILEVGYLGRGGVGLEYHLRTWDLLTANGLYLYGNGVSDAHGSAWGPTMKPNPFATWVWAEEASASELIEALRQGRMVFGDPFQELQTLYFRVGRAEMGDRVEVLGEGQPLEVELGERFLADRHRLFLVQGLIRPSKSRVEYLTGSAEHDYRREIDPLAPPALDVSRPCFVRLEVYDRSGRPLLFSNPIVFEASS